MIKRLRESGEIPVRRDNAEGQYRDLGASALKTDLCSGNDYMDQEHFQESLCVCALSSTNTS